MKIKHVLTAAASVLLLNTGLQAQEEIVYDQYYFNYYLVNPAVAGAEYCTHFMLTGKFQWLGKELEKAPMTQTLSFRTRLPINLGIGAYIYNDRNGNSYRQGGEVTLAYHVPLGGGNTKGYMMKQRSIDRQISFGLSCVVNHYNFDKSLFVDGSTDATLANGGTNKGIYFNANAGVYFLWDDFFAGFSVMNMIPTELTELGEAEPKRPLTPFIFAGYDFQLKKGMQLEPGMMFKFDCGKFSTKQRQLDIHLKFMQELQDKNTDFGYWVELLYRHALDKGNAQALSLSPMGGVRIKKFNIGVVYTLGLTPWNRHNGGTLEAMFGYQFCKTQHFCR